MGARPIPMVRKEEETDVWLREFHTKMNKFHTDINLPLIFLILKSLISRRAPVHLFISVCYIGDY
jgi:hypothetical protein